MKQGHRPRRIFVKIALGHRGARRGVPSFETGRARPRNRRPGTRAVDQPLRQVRMLGAPEGSIAIENLSSAQVAVSPARMMLPEQPQPGLGHSCEVGHTLV